MIDDNTFSYSDSCMLRAEGDVVKSDYLFDTTYFNYFFRLLEYNRYVEEMDRRAKEREQRSK